MFKRRLQSLSLWLAPRRKFVLPLAVVLVAGVFFLVQPAHGFLGDLLQDTAKGVFNGVLYLLATLFLFLSRIAIGFTMWGMEFFISLAQYNGYLDSPFVAVGWVLVRDIGNMFFVVALLMIAIGTILGLENYQWSKTLIKLILAAVLINFSDLICGVFIDIAHVFTITFVNAFANVAGGNITKMFNFDTMYSMVKGGSLESELDKEVLGASIVIFVFSAIACATIIAYLVVMVARVVILWVLIILSPLAFVLQVIPQTEEYAKKWWSKFGKQVVVAPLMAFFLWLAFATMGQGGAAMKLNLAPVADRQLTKDAVGIMPSNSKISLSEASTWENMANFAIPIVLLIIGLGVVQELGVVGGGLAGGAIDFGKKVATIASGYAAGRWLAGKAGEGAKLAGWHVPLIGGKEWGRRVKHIGYSIADWGLGLGKKPEEMGFFQKPVNWFIRREKVADKQLEVRKKLIEEKYALTGKQATSGIYGARLRYVKGEMAAYEERSKVRETADVAKGKRETLEAERIKTRYVGSYRDPVTGEDVAPMISRILGLTYTARVSEQGPMGENVRLKAMQEKEQRDKLETLNAGWDNKFKEEGKKELVERRGINKEIDEAAKPKNIRDLEAQKRQFELQISDKLDAVMSGFFDKLAKISLTQGAKIKEGNQEKEEKEKIIDEAMKTPEFQAWKKMEMEQKRQLEVLEEEYAKMKDTDPNKPPKLLEIGSKKSEIDDHAKKVTDPAVATGPLKKIAEAQQGIEAADAKIKEARETAEAKRTEVTQDAERDLADDLVFQKLNTDLKGVDTSLGAANKAWQGSAAGKAALEDAERRKAYNEVGLGGLARNLRQHDPSLSEEEAQKRAAELVQSGNYDAMFAGRKTADGKDFKAGLSSIGAKVTADEIELAHAKARLEATDKSSLREALGLEELGRVFDATQMQTVMKEGAEKFIDEIKQAKLGNIFKDGMKAMKKEKELRSEILKKEKDYATAGAGAKAGIKGEIDRLQGQLAELAKSAPAQFVRGSIAQRYAADASEVEKTKLMDEADSEYTLKRYGYETPSSAFKALIKKKMTEEFEGVEREKAYKMAYDTIVNSLKIQDAGGELSGDQEAMMMASITYLTKQGWSDDLLGEIKRKIKKSAAGGNLSGTEEYKEGKLLEKKFVDELGWGTKDAKGNLILANDSDPHHTNAMHRLMAMAGNTKLQASEDAVLDVMNKMGVGYSEAIEHLATSIRSSLGTAKNLTGLNGLLADATRFDGLAEGLGFVDEAMKRKLKTFAETFMNNATLADTSRTLTSKSFKSAMDNHTEAFQLLADAKNVALQTGHLDDAGHSYYDVKEGIYRSQTTEDAMAFVLSDWRKLPVNRRLAALKVHSDSAMDEDWGTFEVKDIYKQARRETYRNAETARVYENTDGRNTDGMTGFLSAGGVDKLKDAKGLHIMHHGLQLYKKFYSELEGAYATDAERVAEAERKTMEHTANNMAHNLDDTVIPFLRALGSHSDVKFDEAIKGNLNLVDEKGASIKDVYKLLEWVEEHRSNRREVRLDYTAIHKAISSAKQANKAATP